MSGRPAAASLVEEPAREAALLPRQLHRRAPTVTIEAAVDEVIAENADAAEKVRAGQTNTLGFLVGQVMKKTAGRANPGVVNDLLRRKLVD